MLSRLTLILASVLALTACSDKPDRSHRTDAVLYTIGLSTDPYGDSAPMGFGVATGLPGRKLDKVEVREPGLGGFGGADWLDGGLIVVPRPAPPLRRPLLFGYDGEL